MPILIRRIFIGIIYFPYYAWFFIRGYFILRLKKKNPTKFNEKYPFVKRYQICKNFAHKLLKFYNLKPRFNTSPLIDNFKSGIIMVNHSSMLEPLIASLANDWQIIWITKKQNQEQFFVKIISELSESLFIDRDDPKSASLILLQASRLVKKGYIIGICPEGTRSKSSQLIPFKKGIFEFVKIINHDLLVVGVSNCYRAKQSPQNDQDVLNFAVLKLISKKQIANQSATKLESEVFNLLSDYLKANNLKESSNE